MLHFPLYTFRSIKPFSKKSIKKGHPSFDSKSNLHFFDDKPQKMGISYWKV